MDECGGCVGNVELDRYGIRFDVARVDRTRKPGGGYVLQRFLVTVVLDFETFFSSNPNF